MTNFTKTIIATSGGFAIEPRNKRLDRYILSQSSASRPKICFIPTASGDSKNYIQRFFNFFEKENCVPTHLKLFKADVENREDFLLSQDILYVGGGNTKNMLAIWRDWGIDLILKKAYEKGIILAGISAGSLCWFEQGLSDSIPGKLTALKGLNLLKGSNCPFFDAGKDKQKIYPEMIRSKNILPGVATEVGVGIHYENEKLIGVVTSRKGAKAYVFSNNKGEVEKELMEPKFITLK